MSNILRNGISSEANTVICVPFQNAMNTPSEYITRAAAAGWSVTNIIPTSPTLVSFLTSKNASASQLISAMTQYTAHVGKTLVIEYTRTGTWVLTADPWSTNQGQAYFDQQNALPRPGTMNSYLGYVTNYTPTASALAPTAPTYAATFAGNTNLLHTEITDMFSQLAGKIYVNAGTAKKSVSYCHTSCHNNCHTSRGRR